MSGRRIAILASGEGSNMQAIADACRAGTIAAEIALVLSNRPGAGVLRRAEALSVPSECLDHRAFEDRSAFDKALARSIDARGVDLVVLAGFMRILTETFVRQYYGSLLNIHPSLLPKYPGLNTHQRALDAGDRKTGATVHYVVPMLDAGPTIAQTVVPIAAGDTAETLAERVLIAEHELYPRVIGWWADNRLDLRAERAYLDGEAIGNASADEAHSDAARDGASGLSF